MNFIKIDPADLNSPRRELFIRGIGFIVALLVRWQIDFLSARIGRPTAVSNLKLNDNR